jgi:glycosyltransferase involved in cell wall biosynthesis
VKVCLLSPNFPPEVHAGTEMAVSALALALRRRGVEVVVLTSSDLPHDGVDEIHERYDGLRVLRAKKRTDEWDQSELLRPRLVELVDRFVAAERPDVVHNHSLSVFGTGHVARALRRGIPTVMTIHDLWVTCARFFRLPPAGIVCPQDTDRTTCARCVNLTLGHPDVGHVHEVLRGRERAIVAETDGMRWLSAPSRTAADLVERCMPFARAVEVVPHGLLGEPARMARARAPQPGERLRIGTFGNLVEPKGVLELVRAVAGIDCELHLAGAFLGAEFEARVRALAAELGIALTCHGPYDPRAPHPAERLHLAVFASKCQETYGLVVDEALARGVPVVVSDSGALAERAGTGGVVVTALPSLTAVVHDLARDRDRLQRLAAAVPKALPTIDDAAARYVELYRAAGAS